MSDPGRPHLTRKDYSVAFICAPKSTELTVVKEMLDESFEVPEDASLETYDPNAYTFGRMGNHNVVITVNVLAATQLLNDFNSIRFGLLVGTGSRVPGGNARLGDVVVSDPRGISGGVIQFARGTITSGKDYIPIGSLNKPPAVLRAHVRQLISDHEIRDSLFAYINFKLSKKSRKNYIHQGTKDDRLYDASSPHHQAEDGSKQCDRLQLNLAGNLRNTLTIHYGTIGSSDMTIHKREDREVLKSQQGVLCLEEAAGLMDHFPCLVIWGVADYRTRPQWRAAITAAAYAYMLLFIIPSLKTTPSPIQEGT
jgi:nucleoside phosphorylase